MIGLYRRLFPVASVVRVRPPIVNRRLLAVGGPPVSDVLEAIDPYHFHEIHDNFDAS